MAQFFSVHPTHPQHRLIAQAAQIVRAGGVIGYPTDSSYALGCHLADKDSADRLRRIRGVDEKHHLTLVCSDLAQVAVFAKVDTVRYRFLKQHTPGSFTFILEATKEVPRRTLNPKRKTIGVRIPGHPVVQALLAELGEPLLSATAMFRGEEEAVSDAQLLREALEHELALVMDAGACGIEPTTVIDLTGEQAVVLRQGAGRIESNMFVS